MVANLGDKIIVEDDEKFIKDVKKIQWSQDFGIRKSADFVFIPFYVATNAKDMGFIAIEAAKMAEFRSLCKVVEGGAGVTKYEFTVTKQFKHGHDTEKNLRFLAFLNESYKPSQHRLIEAAHTTEAEATLSRLVKEQGDPFITSPFIQDNLHIIVCYSGDDSLRSF